MSKIIYAVPIEEVIIDKNKHYRLYVYGCGRCHNLFGVDWSWIEHSDQNPVCPMCGQLNIVEEE